ncbi:MAG: type II toxin-antitoxin system VapC family toxin [Terriglobales bacterium]
MILVDTSVWIRVWTGAHGFQATMALLRQRPEIGGHELVHGELLAGDRGGRAAVLAEYMRLPWAPRLAHAEVAHFVRLRGLHGRGAGWVDLHLLASALVRRWRLWSADERTAALADELGIGFKM